jgi:hypothetical protein
MSEAATEATATEATETEATDPPAASEPPKPTETVDFWKQKSRENEKRAKENADAAKRLAEIEESQKSAEQKQADRIAQLEKEANDARTEALRFKVASKHGISDEDADLFLTGSDEETLTKQAERLAGKADERKRNGNHVPGEGTTPPPGEAGDRAFARSLFSEG